MGVGDGLKDKQAKRSALFGETSTHRRGENSHWPVGKQLKQIQEGKEQPYKERIETQSVRASMKGGKGTLRRKYLPQELTRQERIREHAEGKSKTMKHMALSTSRKEFQAVCQAQKRPGKIREGGTVGYVETGEIDMLVWKSHEEMGGTHLPIDRTLEEKKRCVSTQQQGKEDTQGCTLLKPKRRREKVE